MNTEIDAVDEAYLALIKAVNKEYIYLTSKEKDDFIDQISMIVNLYSNKNDERQEKKARIKRLQRRKRY